MSSPLPLKPFPSRLCSRDITQENAPSERLLRKLGFRFTHQEFYPPTGLLKPAYLLENPKAL